MYREPLEKKAVQRRIVLTQDEVSTIVRKHLVAAGKLTETLEDGHLAVACLVPKDYGLTEPKARDFGPWPAVIISWTEQLPE